MSRASAWMSFATASPSLTKPRPRTRRAKPWSKKSSTNFQFPDPARNKGQKNPCAFRIAQCAGSSQSSAMKLLTTLILLVPASLLLASDQEEPALSYTLRLDKETVRLTPGTAVEIKGRFDNPKATLVPDTERLFTYGQITFKYPANFAFEADFDTEGVKLWTLDGNSFVIMVHQYESIEMTPRAFADQLKGHY